MLKKYIKTAKNIRTGEKVVVAKVSPQKEESRGNIFRWLTGILHRAGINTKIFKPHNRRMAATSKAAGLHVSARSVIGTAGAVTARLSLITIKQ